MRRISGDDPLESILPAIRLPPDVTLRPWEDADFSEVQRLSIVEGWTTPRDRPDAALAAWRHSWPALVAVAEGRVIGFLRGLGDGAVTTYIAEVLVTPEWRGWGIGSALLDAAQRLAPGSRLDLLSTGASDAFYDRSGFRRFSGRRRSWEELLGDGELRGLGV